MARGHCTVVDYMCLAPAGYRTGGGGLASQPQQTGLKRCAYCQETVCTNCSTTMGSKVLCNSHEAYEVLQWLALKPGEDVNV